MSKVTVLFGVLLIVLGGASFALTGYKFPTSLIPVAFGILLKLLHIEFLRGDDSSNILGEALPLRVLCSDDALNEISECRFIFVVLDHSETCK